MKRLLAFLLALVLALPTLTLAEDVPLISYVSDFTQGTDGWYPRSAGQAALIAEDGVLTITGRNATWNSPGREFNLQPGKKYRITVQVMHHEDEPFELMLSAAHSRNGSESYENLGKVKANKGCWTTIQASYTPAQYDNYILYVETVGMGTRDFSIRNFTLELDQPAYDMSLPSLKEAYADYFDFGCAVTQSEALDKARMDFYASQFCIVTPGNELKPDFVLDVAASRQLAKDDETAVAVRFDAAKPMLDYCQANGLKVHGHVLVWHSQTPEAFFREGYQASGAFVTREVMLARLDNYIHQVMDYMQANYPGLIVSWDVVNEAIADGTGKLRESNWTKVVGEDFVNQTFEIARRYAPEGTKLFYNDYNTPDPTKLTGIVKLLESLVADGNIDGYGLQGHYGSTTPTPSKVRAAMEQISALGLRLRISELDIAISDNSDVKQLTQAYRYKALFELFLEYADKIDAVQVWGVTDDLSWKASEYPLLFDGKARPKPAFTTLIELASTLEK